MKANITWSRLIAIAAFLLGFVLLGWSLVRPWWHTQIYGPELKEAIRRYNEVLGTEEGWQDPSVMAQVATGKNLDYLIQTRCRSCPSVQVVTGVDVQVLQVLEYSPTVSKVVARVEEGWHKVSLSTGDVLGSCHAQAYTVIHILVRENGVWKVADGEQADRDSVDDSPELRAKYCSSD